MASDRFELGLKHLRRYVAERGTSRVPRSVVVDGFRLGVWVDQRRAQYRAGRLPADRAAQLESEFPDWRWNVYDAQFEDGLGYLRRYVELHGTSNVRQHAVIDGFRIGQWVANRRSDHRDGRLPPEQIALLESEFPDWRWNVYDAQFEDGVAYLRRYVELHGTSCARRSDVIDGFRIGQWVANRRKEYRAGRLSVDRAARLETEFPDWEWTTNRQAS